MKNKSEYINRRIESLFGEVGGDNGQFYCWGSSIVKVINTGGGVRTILTGKNLTDLIDKLDTIEDYLRFKEYENNLKLK